MRRYAIFVAALEAAAGDNLDWIKEKALKAAFELLAAKPEAEARLLRLLVNKLGDPNRKVASKAGYLLSCLLTRHPLMGGVVVREVESFLFRCALL
jgi:ribosome biogenesis protein MAK21